MQLFAVLAALLVQLTRDLNFEKTHTRPSMSAKHVTVKSVCGTGPISRGIDQNVYQKRGMTPRMCAMSVAQLRAMFKADALVTCLQCDILSGANLKFDEIPICSLGFRSCFTLTIGEKIQHVGKRPRKTSGRARKKSGRNDSRAAEQHASKAYARSRITTTCSRKLESKELELKSLPVSSYKAQEHTTNCSGSGHGHQLEEPHSPAG